MIPSDLVLLYCLVLLANFSAERRMMNEGKGAGIRATALGTELSDEQVELLASVAEVLQLSDGQVLIEQGDRDDRMFAVVSGALEVGLPAAKGREWTTFVRLRPGEIAGELGFLEDMRRTATVRAAGETTVVALRRAALESLLDRDPVLIYRVMRAILRSVHQVVSNMNSEHSQLVNYIMG